MVKDMLFDILGNKTKPEYGKKLIKKAVVEAKEVFFRAVI
jgi:hypothetical protein